MTVVAVEPPKLMLRRRIEVAGEGFAAVAGTLAIGVAGALVIAALVLGIVLSVVWIGLPLVLAALAPPARWSGSSCGRAPATCARSCPAVVTRSTRTPTTASAASAA